MALTDQQEFMAQGNKILTLNKVEIVIGVCVGLLTIANSAGTWSVIPYQVLELKSKNAELEAKIDQQAADFKAENLRRDERDAAQRELLIRMDERLKTVQGALKIPTAQ